MGMQGRVGSANFQHLEARDAKAAKANRAGRSADGCPRPTLASKAARCGHVFSWNERGLGHCAGCKQIVSRRSFGRWLAGNQKCRSEASGDLVSLPGPVPAFRPASSADAALTLGNSSVDPSHRLICSVGYWWCDNCGAHAAATSKPAAKFLTMLCRHARGLQPTRYGAYALGRLRQGLAPVGRKAGVTAESGTTRPCPQTSELRRDPPQQDKCTALAAELHS